MRDAGKDSAAAELRRLANCTVWLTGLPSSGKTSLAWAVCERLRAGGRPTVVLDGDELRAGINSDLGFSKEDRGEVARRVGALAVTLARQGIVPVVALVSPYEEHRRNARDLHFRQGLRFVEVFVATPLEQCERRDQKGLYARARRQEFAGMSGLDDPYEAPSNPEVVIRNQPLADAADAVLAALSAR